MSREISIPLPPLLELTSRQLEVALQSASAQVERLASSVAEFTRLAVEMNAHADATVAAHGARLAAEAQRAMFAMQFLDQLTQRITHVRDALGDMHDALAAPVLPPTHLLLAVIRARYTMEDERRLFDVMLSHLPEAGGVGTDTSSEPPRGGVELF
jgi:hypothetical protein